MLIEKHARNQSVMGSKYEKYNQLKHRVTHKNTEVFGCLVKK